MKNKLVTIILNALALLTSALLMGIALSVFLVPNNLAIGGVIGISQILYLLFNGVVPLGVIIITLNIPLCIIAYKYIDKIFAIKTIICVSLIGGFIELIKYIDLVSILNIPEVKQNLVLYTIMGAILVSLSLFASVFVETSTGGDDIVSLLLQKKFKLNHTYRWFILLDILIVAIFALLNKNFDVFIYSVTAVITSEITYQVVQNGLPSAVAFEIITDDPTLLVEQLNAKLNRGISVIKAIGMYKKTEKHIVLCIVRKRQEALAKEIIRDLEAEAFAYSVPVREVIGRGFKRATYNK